MKWIKSEQVDLIDLQTTHKDLEIYDTIEVIESWDDACIENYQQAYGISDYEGALKKFNEMILDKYLQDFYLEKSYFKEPTTSISVFKRR